MAVAIITGASSGIGSEFAKCLHELIGIDEFWFIARRGEKMEALAKKLRVKAKIISADLTKSEEIDKIKSELDSEKPRVSYLVNAAGFGDFGAFDEVSEADVAKMIDLNVKALVLITHAVIPYMVRGARIIELGSASCFTPLPYFNVYASSKAFVLHYTKALNHEIKKYGITATCFCPGWVDTDFIDKALQNGNTTHPKKMKPLLSCEKVVRNCVRAAEAGKPMYVTNWYTKLQHLLFKILPDSILTWGWLGMQKFPDKEKPEVLKMNKCDNKNDDISENEAEKDD